jgi:hypothetical protein
MLKRDRADFKEVRQREFRAIKERRACRGMAHDEKNLPNDLCGLALSGGGIRSAAMSLGFLDSLRERKLLRFVDYLSTVSGGGYAGAHYSSKALANLDGDDVCGESDSSSDDQTWHGASGEQPSKDQADKATGSDAKLGDRMLRFVYGGNYLRKTWLFFNRYLIGLLLVWTVLISGLLAIAAAGALAFRCLDYPVVRTAIGAIGFDGDVWLALFPSFVLLMVWAVAWTLSYLKFSARATGTVARWVFYVLVFVTLIAVASLIGAGQISFAANTADVTGAPTSATSNTTGKTIYTIVLSALAASLVPYLAPKKLLRSGLSPRNAAEKYAFWIATRAVAYGIPFVAIAFLTRENISEWNERRDDRLTRAEIAEWSPMNPMWRELLEKKTTSQPFGRIWPVGTNRTLAKQLFDELTLTSNAQKPAETDVNEWPSMEADKAAAEEKLKAAPSNKDPDHVAPSRDQVVASRTLREVESSFFDRWGHFGAYLLHHAVLDTDGARRGKFSSDWNARFHPLQLQDRLTYQVNECLKSPVFYRGLWPVASWETSQDVPAVIRVPLRFVDLAERVKLLPPDTLPADAGELRAALERQRESHLRREFRVAHLGGPSADKFEDEFARWREELNRRATEAERLNALPDNVWGPLGDVKKGPETLDEAAARERREIAVLKVNRQLMATYFGDHIRKKSVVYSANVLHEDQWTRVRWFLWSLGIFLAAGFCMDLNATSLHGFYSTQVGQSWIEPTSSFGRNIPLAELRTTRAGEPYHLINGTVQLFGTGAGRQVMQQEAFLFSQLYCGCNSLQFARTSKYMGGSYELDDAIAVSGAAVSPALSQNPLVLVLLWLANMRLGQWVDNPSDQCPQRMEGLAPLGRWPVTPLRVLANLFREPVKRRMCFVTDGGHYENLGIEPLLLRRCRLILALDAGQDTDYSFADFTRVARRVRMMHGIRLRPWKDEGAPLRLDAISPPLGKPEDDRRKKCSPDASGDDVEARSEADAAVRKRVSEEHFVILRIVYPKRDDSEELPDGCLVYVKSTLTGDEPLDLFQFAKTNVHFPHDETADQFFDPERFESYRQLGFHLGEHLCKHFGPGLLVAVATNSHDMLYNLLGTEASEAEPQERETERQAPHSAGVADADLQSSLRKIEGLLAANDDNGAMAALGKIFADHSAVVLAMPEVIRLMIQFDSEVLRSNLRGLMDQHPNEAVAALCGVLSEPHDLRIKVYAIQLLAELFKSVPTRLDPQIITALIEVLQLATPSAVIKAALKELEKLAPGNKTASAKAKFLAENDRRKAVVRTAKRFLEMAAG